LQAKPPWNMIWSSRGTTGVGKSRITCCVAPYRQSKHLENSDQIKQAGNSRANSTESRFSSAKRADKQNLSSNMSRHCRRKMLPPEGLCVLIQHRAYPVNMSDFKLRSINYRFDQLSSAARGCARNPQLQSIIRQSRHSQQRFATMIYVHSSGPTHSTPRDSRTCF
jgi:hypothetical protein